MQDRPIRSPEWAQYTIEGDVASDATRIVLGMMMTGSGSAEIDSVRLTDIGPAKDPTSTASVETRRAGPPRAAAMEGDVAPSQVSPQGLGNLAAFARLYGLVRWFHPSDAAAGVDWYRFAIAAIPQVEAAATPAELAATLERVFAPYAPELVVSRQPIAAADRAGPLTGEVYRWKHTGLGGTGQVYSSEREKIAASAQRPFVSGELAVSGGQGEMLYYALPLTAPVAAETQAPATPDWGKPEGWIPAGYDRTTRLADTITAWALLDHFYPYWDTVDVDWNAELRARLADAATAADDDAFVAVLERLIEPLDDGHARVVYRNNFQAGLPLQWRWIEDRLVVTAVGEGAEALDVGIVVETIDGIAADAALAAHMSRISGSPQSKRIVAPMRERWFPAPTERVLGVVGPDGARRQVRIESVPGAQAAEVREARPDPVAQLEPGILYVDLTRWNDAIFAENLDRLAQAKGIVFDMRGYPKGSPAYLEHLITAPSRSPAFQRPVVTRPDAAASYPGDGGWKLTPKSPHIGAKTVFLIDARAVSYSESIMGTVQGNELGTIIGSPTAGANGNRSDFLLPGGYGVSYTGMRVTNRDGTLQHIRGVVPDIAVHPTLAGIRAGRDEVLEAGLAELKRQLSVD